MNEVMAAHGNDAGWAVNEITNTTLGNFGAVLALLGVVAAPITSGDTAFRSARLITADFLHMDQRSLKKRLYICIPLFAAGFVITMMRFDVLWRYFAWANQVLAAICLWTVTVYLARNGKNMFIVLFPAVFMTFIVSFYILFAPEGFSMPYMAGFAVALAVTGGITAVMAAHIRKKKAECVLK